MPALHWAEGRATWVPESLEASIVASVHHSRKNPLSRLRGTDVGSTDNVPVRLSFVASSRTRVGLRHRVGSVSCGAARLDRLAPLLAQADLVTRPVTLPLDHDRLPRLTKRLLRARLSQDGSMASRPNHGQVMGVSGEAEWPGDTVYLAESALDQLR
jgi:hypothetical protein